MSKSLITLSLALAALPFTTTAADARPMTPEDLATFNRLGDHAVSPDGKTLVYALTRTDLAANKRTTALYRIDIGKPEAPAVQIGDRPDASESSPAFSPDGKHLFFLSGGQVWRVAVTGGEPKQVTNAAADLSGFALSPDGMHLAVWADLAEDCTLAGCTDTSEPVMGSGRVYDHLFVRHWDEWEVPGTYSRVFAYALGADGAVDGDAVELTRNLTGDAPTKPFGGGEEIAWFADSSAVAFVMRKADADEPNSTNTDIIVSPVDPDQPVVNLSAANLAADTLPAPSPDGRYLAWAAMARPGYESDRLVVQLLEIATGKLTALTKDWDRSVGSIAWAKDSRSLIVTAGDTLETPAFRVDVPTGKVTRLTERGHIGAITPLAGGGMVYSIDSLAAPADLVLMRANGQTVRLTNVNAEKLADIDPVEYSKFSFKGAGGDTVWGQIVKPAGATGKLPLAFVVHGGPQGSFGNSWSYRWNPKIMAEQGYAVVTVDFHGSTGYGQAFTDSINRDWGGKPLEDLQLGLAAAGETDPQIDTENACALGASYGGFMMNWIEGNWPDQFKCIVNHDGLFDLRSMYYSTEELWFPEWDLGGPYFEASEIHERWNPANHVTKWKTPMLVIHGEKDFRVPLEQGLAAFTALQRQDIPSKLLVFPDENHWVLKAQNSVQWHHEVFDWLARWLKDGGK